MKKFFFMAVITANFENRPVVQFNTISALDTRNVLATDLAKIQDAAARMVGEHIVFDNLLIQNLFFLAEATPEEFTAGTDLLAQPENEHVQEEGTETLEEFPVEDVTTADVTTEQ